MRLSDALCQLAGIEDDNDHFNVLSIFTHEDGGVLMQAEKRVSELTDRIRQMAETAALIADHGFSE